MPELVICTFCHREVHRDDWPAHQCLPLAAKPKLPVAGWLIRAEKGRVHIITLGPMPMLGSLIVAGTVLIEADWSISELAIAMGYLANELQNSSD